MNLCHYCGIPCEDALHVLLDLSERDENGEVDLSAEEDCTGAWACTTCVPRCETCKSPLAKENGTCDWCGGDPETENYWGW